MRAIDVRDLLDQPGSSKHVRVEESVEGLKTELAAVPEGENLEGDLLLESVVEGIVVRGSVGGRMRLRCARCLKEFDRDFDVRMDELYAREPGPEDDYVLADDVLDPEPMVRDAVVLEMPYAPVCRPDCQGLCERCGGDRNLGECVCAPEVDPRWAGLDALLDEAALGSHERPARPDDR